MTRLTHPSRANEIARRLLPAVALAFVLGWRGEAPASAVTLAPTSAFLDEHAEHCKCRNCRKESCCCGPRRAKPAQTPIVPKSGPARTSGGPCMGAAPCGDAGLPDAPVPGPSGKVASLAIGAVAIPPMSGGLLPPDGRCILPSRRASRLDEPPERLDLA